MSETPTANNAPELTHQSLSDKFESPFDLVLYAIQRAREQVALQTSGAVLPADSIAQDVLREISQSSEKKIEPIFDRVDQAPHSALLTGQLRSDARRASSPRKRKRAVSPDSQT